MRKLLFSLVVGATVVLMGTTLALASTLNFDSIPNASITFYGDNDSFALLPDATNFEITSVVAAADADSVGLRGAIVGTFAVGAITEPYPGLQMARVTGMGTLTIVDEEGIPLTANIEWLDAATIGTGGVLNVHGGANLTGIAYEGANADLLHLVVAESGIASLSFQLAPARSLDGLMLDGRVSMTSFSGTIVPEPGTILLIGTGLLGLAAAQRNRRARENPARR